MFGLHADSEYERCDLDNRIKTIFDALKSVVYIDDCQVKILWSHKEFLKNSECSYYQIAVKILDKPSLEYFSELSNNFR